MSADSPIRVMCVDDHQLVREGLALIIEQQRDMTVVAMAADGDEAVMQYRQHRPDVTLMDLRLRTVHGVEAIRRIRRFDQSARFVVLTMYDGDDDIYRALEAGAETYLLKDMLSADLVRVIRLVHAGECARSPEVRERLAQRAAMPRLTAREAAVMNLLAQGLRNKEIAALMGISEETVHVHLKNVFTKLDVHDRTAAVRAAVLRGIVHLR